MSETYPHPSAVRQLLSPPKTMTAAKYGSTQTICRKTNEFRDRHSDEDKVNSASN
jgi:hypothetical protein